MAAVNLIGSYNYALVALSVLIAILTSYAALDLASRVMAAGGWTRAVWLLGGAGVMGTGIWSMHYIGMLACILPISVAYHWPTVLLSLFAAILASAIALYAVSRQKMDSSQALAGSLLMGGGIASMHYIGMAAMRLSATTHYDSFLVVLSVVFAVLISLAALWITFHFRDEKTGIGWRKIAGSVVMGAAIPIMHYTAMAAASFRPSRILPDLSRAVSISTLGTVGIVAATLIVLGLALLTSWLDRRFAAQALERQEEKLQQSEAYLSEAQRLSHTGSFGWRISSGEISWSEETFRIFEYDPTTKPTVELILQRVHPEDTALVRETIQRASQDGKDFDFEHRLLMPDGAVKHLHIVAHAERDKSGELEFIGAVMDVTVAKEAGEKLRRSEEKYRDLINASPDAIYVMDADGVCMMANPAGAKLIGHSEDELIGSSIAQTFLPEQRHLLKQNIERLKVEGSLQFERKFLRRNGEVIPVEVSLSPLRGRYYQSILRDISHRKRREALLAAENRVLEMVAKGDALTAILDHLCLMVEEQSFGVLASILLMDANGKQLRHGGAPNLPKAYTDAIDGAYIGPSVGSCGTAAYRGEQVIVSDIASDPLWNDFRDLALGHSLRACWSTPIFSSEGKVIGTFAMYYAEPREASTQEQETIKHITHLAGIAIERKLAERARRESEAYLEEAQRLSHTGSWATPANGEIRYWSEETFRVLGFDPHDGTPRFETFIQRLHSDDQVRVRQLFEDSVRDKADFETDYRVVHQGGAIRNIHAVGHPVCDEIGNLVEFVGTVMDVTEAKHAEEASRASEQLARGQVEAMAHSLDVLATAPAPDKFLGQMLSTIGRLLDAQSVILWLLDEDNDSLVLRAWAEGENFVKGDPEHPFIKDPLSWKEDPGLQEMFFAGAPVSCEDIEHDPSISSALRKYLLSGKTKKFLRIPTLVGGEVKGFIGIRHATRSPYRPEEIELAQALAHQAMLAIQLNRLAEQSQHAAILAERNRMARDIHDTLAQGFTGVIVQLEAVADAISSGDHKEAGKYLLRASALARQSLNEARRSVHALRPEALRRANFWDALKGIIKNTTTGSRLSTKVKLKGEVPDLPPDWEENLMHIGQEVLTNALKYAHADRFEALLTCNAKELRLQFQDDGDGFAVKDRHDGFGLAGMRERVEEMGGELRITSARGKGTKVSVVLPLNGK
jgi:PAS domain S-box-containing protein